MKRPVAAAAALVTVAVFSPGTAFAHANTADAPTQSLTTVTSTSGHEGLTGELVELSGMPLGRGNRLDVTVLATNTATAAHEDVVLRMDLTQEPLHTREDLAAFLSDPNTIAMRAVAQQPAASEQASSGGSEGSGGTARNEGGGSSTGSAGSEGDRTGPAVGVRVGPQSSRSFSLQTNSAALDLPAHGWGVYGASVVLVTDGTEVAVDSFPFVWGHQAVPRLDLAVVAAAYGAPSRIADVLEASNIPGVATAVDPMTLTNANMFDLGLLEREVFRLAGASPDLSSLAHAEDESLMPLSLSLPAGPNVGRWESAPWLALPAVIDSRSVEYANEFGATAVLAQPSAVGFGVLADAAQASVVNADGTSVLVPDARLSEAVTTFRPGSVAAQARAVADSALLAKEAKGTPTLIVLDNQWPADAAATETLEVLLDAPWVATTSVARLLSETSPAVSLTEVLDQTLDMPVEQVAELESLLTRLTLLASVADSPSDALAQWGAELLGGISVMARGDTAVRDFAFDAAVENADATLAALRIAESSDLNLLAESGDIPVNVINGLDHPVTVRVDVTSSSPNLQILDSPTITVPAGSNVVALVPVEAVSSANVNLSTVLRNDEGAAVSDTNWYSVRVRADWGNAATAIFTAILVLLLVAGLIRTIRRGRKDTRVEPAPAPDIAPPAAPSPRNANRNDRD